MASILKFGSTGDDVVHLQKKLNDILRPVPPLKSDGKFGPRTESLVKLFQAKYGLGIDGVVGPKTWTALEAGSKIKASVVPPTPSYANAPWMEFAIREQGVSEIDGAQHNPKIIEYHSTTTLKASTDEVPWCSSFVNWCLKKARVAGTNSALAESWLRWGKEVGAKPGAITVINNHKPSAAVSTGFTSTGYHVGFFVLQTAEYVWLLGGNQSNCVKVSRYPKTSWIIKGCRWPA